MKEYAVEHTLGLSLFKADRKESALAKAKRMFGDHAGPYRLATDQEGAISWSKAMGAMVHE